MEVKDVVKIAINYVADVFGEEQPSHIGLEEVIFQDSDNIWKVTIGFSRPWDYQSPGFVSSLQAKPPTRQYKIVEVSDLDGKVKAIKIRE